MLWGVICWCGLFALVKTRERQQKEGAGAGKEQAQGAISSRITLPSSLCVPECSDACKNDVNHMLWPSQSPMTLGCPVFCRAHWSCSGFMWRPELDQSMSPVSVLRCHHLWTAGKMWCSSAATFRLVVCELEGRWFDRRLSKYLWARLWPQIASSASVGVWIFVWWLESGWRHRMNHCEWVNVTLSV